MHGTNPVTKPNYRTDGALYIKEVFYTLQCEGPRAGQPAVFVRLAGCNLRCYFCDTEFDNGELVDLVPLTDRIIDTRRADCRLVVLTGGEPMAQQLLPLVAALHQAGFIAQVETAGTCAPPPIGDNSCASLVDVGALEIVCSPKTPTLAREIRLLCRHFKYVVAHGELDPSDGLPMMSTQQQGRVSRIVRPPTGATVYLQPMADHDRETSNQNVQQAVRACLTHGYRLSLQQHKIVGVP